jgi:Subtilase family
MRACLAVLVVALGAASPAVAGRVAVGVAAGASPHAVAARLERATGARVDVDPELRAVFVRSHRPASLRGLPGVAYVDRLRATRTLAFVPNDPLLSKQWYLQVSNAFGFWPQLPTLTPVKIAVVDSGIDGRHPEFAHRVTAAKSFVGGSPWNDREGHGTFVAGEIAAATNNGQGIAGIAFAASLMVAKVVQRDRTIPLEAEAKAIRWAVDNGAQVINLSLSGVRDPRNPNRDTFSPLEASAVSYAVSKGALIVAAVGNGDQAPRMPWDFAGWPAALPHVLGVSAFSRDGSVPPFSDRDQFYNDISAPGDDIVSTFPRSLTEERPSCDDQGYSTCASGEYRSAEGTSFAAPQVAAAAALLLAAQPALTADQVANVLTRTANDGRRENGCQSCLVGRDSLTGWGKLDIQSALAQATYTRPPSDTLEPNDDAGSRAHRLYGRGSRTIEATLDYWDDQIDVYAVYLRRGQKLGAALKGSAAGHAKLVLWKPGTQRVEGFRVPKTRARASVRVGGTPRLPAYAARQSGWHYLEVKLQSPAAGPYSLTYSKSSAAVQPG